MKTRSGARAQAGLEYITIIAMVLVVILAVFYYGYQDATNKSRVAQAETAIGRIAEAADLVYAQGPGAKTVARVMLPAGISSVYSQLNVVGFKLLAGGSRPTDVLRVVRGNVTANFSTFEGMHYLEVSYNETAGSVVIFSVD